MSPRSAIESLRRPLPAFPLPSAWRDVLSIDMAEVPQPVPDTIPMPPSPHPEPISPEPVPPEVQEPPAPGGLEPVREPGGTPPPQAGWH